MTAPNQRAERPSAVEQGNPIAVFGFAADFSKTDGGPMGVSGYATDSEGIPSGKRRALPV